MTEQDELPNAKRHATMLSSSPTPANSQSQRPSLPSNASTSALSESPDGSLPRRTPVDWRPVPVLLAEVESHTMPTARAIVARVDLPKQMSAVIAFIQQCMQPESARLEHLRRVRKPSNSVMQVLICLVDSVPLLRTHHEISTPSDTSSGSDAACNGNSSSSLTSDQLLLGIKSLLQSRGVADDKSQVLESLSLCVTDVPERIAANQQQHAAGNALWPLAHASALTAAKNSALAEMLFSDDELQRMDGYMDIAIAQAQAARAQGNSPIGAVVVDPATNTILASVGDCSREHTLAHAAMVAIARVADAQRQEYLAALQQGENGAPASAEAGNSRPVAELPYLCTSYDLYITREPCVMCSMALVHSRVGRVFFGTPHPDMGGLAGARRIHAEPKLNHHFLAFRGVAERRCAALFCDGADTE
ncbi:hypothetical protein CAOG_08612 [Capsaspora owczarzaki ATCC 30864]|uniref:CMP/dCMP-type deaminase domain-containing protein n=1 Tax=Capsaspora owczarzaki (strain ATCC 30864) TaxID=595528 RepID=A0A0D2U8D1_CAPO3|nr:hypothetical protein CAOG_08612 [Capsaspora owczarzaki ATCC 30864]KJE91356.1 hypothetical protein CAOG_008612 [Capsaspora owczarzaki ATCC 30864]|eukprot:XP_011270212.1 hypothetical protein CAOG_08612 [Capsaspora owczarzaki ATCC 30864]